MELILTRIGEVKRSLFGVLTFEGDTTKLFTVERGWLGNRPKVSCVPQGYYRLEPHASEKHGDTWALVGTTVAHFESAMKSRFAILFHAANFADELLGCIAPGSAILDINGRIGVSRSRNAMDALRHLLRSDDDIRRDVAHGLTIVDARGSYIE